MKSRSGSQGISSNKAVKPPTRDGAPRQGITPGYAGQLGAIQGNHTTRGGDSGLARLGWASARGRAARRLARVVARVGAAIKKWERDAPCGVGF